MPRRLWTGAVALATGALLLLCACGGASGSGSSSTSGPLKGSIVFQTWSLKNATFTPYFTGLIQKFEQQHRGTTINWIDQPGDGYADKVTSQYTSNSLPDVINLPNNIAYSIAKVGGLENLAAADPSLDSVYSKAGLDAYDYGQFGTKGVYGFPWYLGTNVNYWNKAMLQRDGLNPEAPPTTFDELFQQAKTMHDKSGGKDYLISTTPDLQTLLSMAGVNSAMTKNGKQFDYNSKAVAAALDQWVAAYKAGEMPSNILTTAYEGNSKLFQEQEVAWTTGTGYYIASTEKTNPTLAAQIVPSYAFGVPPIFAQGLSVSKKSKNLPLALAFAEFVTNNQNQVAFTDLAKGFLPGTKAAAKSPAGTDSGTQAQADTFAFKALNSARSLSPVIFNSTMSTYFNQQISLALSGQQSSMTALTNSVNEANQLLNG